MRISDWSSDVCSSDLAGGRLGRDSGAGHRRGRPAEPAAVPRLCAAVLQSSAHCRLHETAPLVRGSLRRRLRRRGAEDPDSEAELDRIVVRSEEHTSELQSLMRLSYAVFCLNTKNNNPTQ